MSNSIRKLAVVASDITCPVTKKIFLDSYTIYPMGVTIEKEVAEYLLRNNLSYPNFNGEPKITAIAPNWAANNLVQKYFLNHPNEKNLQYVNGTYSFPLTNQPTPIRRL